MNILKKIGGTIMLPAAMFIAMYILCAANGVSYYGKWVMWQTLIPDICVAFTCALGIGLQFKNGRFDFSGGGIMLLSAIIAGNVARDNGNSLALMCLLCLVLCVGLSLGVALLYVYGRLPIVIATIGMALLYESVTALIYRGGGISLVSNMTLRKFCTFPYVLIPAVLAYLVYWLYSDFTVAGRQGSLLSNNQSSAVNIGIDEGKNVIFSYLCSGVLFGLATIIYIGKSMHDASFSSLSTASELFSNILPVFIGLMLMNFCNDAMGTLMGAVALSLMSYSLKAVFSNEMGSAITMVITGIFILVINVVSAQGGTWIAAIKKKMSKSKA